MPGIFQNDDTGRSYSTGTTMVAGSDVTIPESLLSETNPFQGARKLSRVGVEVLIDVTAQAAAGTTVKMTWNTAPIIATLPILPVGCHRVKFDGFCTQTSRTVKFSVVTSAMSGPVTTSGGVATYDVGVTPTRPVVVNLGAGGAGTALVMATQND